MVLDACGLRKFPDAVFFLLKGCAAGACWLQLVREGRRACGVGLAGALGAGCRGRLEPLARYKLTSYGTPFVLFQNFRLIPIPVPHCKSLPGAISLEGGRWSDFPLNKMNYGGALYHYVINNYYRKPHHNIIIS